MKKKILVVDDSPFILKVIDDILTELNYDVTTANDGFQGYDFVVANPFDLIITDLHMPKMCGIEFTKKVKALASRRFTPIVMLSAEDDQEKISEAKMNGISTFLTKPIKESQLKSILQIAIGSQISATA